MSCAAYYPKTSRVQACTCSASLIEHMPVVNVHRVPATPPNVDNALPSNVNTFTGDATNIPFTQVPMPAPSTNDVPSYSYSDVSARFREDYPIAIYSTAHGAEAWAGQLG
ncbi:hypothetical protein ARMGADRAFT_1009928 [Armillaria gallica]|uniref:Uncharacterized protein n=1 Tax=Armillaria gallica TaxID=47427 RepID=A0A2H3DQX8_ARMGA|nr:hypothetical protein ARMGADRAFT_1009928 [Armillaria gallica]